MSPNRRARQCRTEASALRFLLTQRCGSRRISSAKEQPDFRLKTRKRKSAQFFFLVLRTDAELTFNLSAVDLELFLPQKIASSLSSLEMCLVRKKMRPYQHEIPSAQTDSATALGCGIIASPVPQPAAESPKRQDQQEESMLRAISPELIRAILMGVGGRGVEARR